jgi:TPR repeat protein
METYYPCCGKSICVGCDYSFDQSGRLNGFQLDQAKAMELYTGAAELGYTKAHNRLGEIYHVHRGELRKAKFYYEAAAMAGHENARFALGILEYDSGNMGSAIKHFMIAASAGDYHAMFALLISLKKRGVSRESIDSTLAAYNSSCAEMRSEARDARIKVVMK